MYKYRPRWFLDQLRNHPGMTRDLHSCRIPLTSSLRSALLQHIGPSTKQWLIPFAVQLIPGGLFAIGIPLFVRWIPPRSLPERAVADPPSIRRSRRALAGSSLATAVTRPSRTCVSFASSMLKSLTSSKVSRRLDAEVVDSHRHESSLDGRLTCGSSLSRQKSTPSISRSSTTQPPLAPVSGLPSSRSLGDGILPVV